MVQNKTISYCYILIKKDLPFNDYTLRLKYKENPVWSNIFIEYIINSFSSLLFWIIYIL